MTLNQFELVDSHSKAYGDGAAFSSARAGGLLFFLRKFMRHSRARPQTAFREMAHRARDRVFASLVKARPDTVYAACDRGM